MTAKVVLLDIETAPNLGWIWGKYEQDVIAFEQQWFLLCFSYRWLTAEGDGVRCCALPDYDGYAEAPTHDGKLTQALWGVFDEADVIIAHNGDAFDIKKANAKFIQHELPPPSPYKTIDTLKIAKKHFKFESNKLNDLGEYLGVGHKASTGGFGLWKRCMDGDVDAWEKMRAYNVQDVALLEKVYYKLRPWSSSHPNLSLYSNSNDLRCPTCGSEHIQKRGSAYTRLQVRQRLQCQECSAWFQGGLIKR